MIAVSESLGLWAVAYGVVGFLVGSYPPAIPIARAYGADVMSTGDRNPGVSNVREQAGTTASAICVFADIAIGLLVALVPYWIGGSVWDAAIASMAMIAGRAFSPWFGFMGGRAQMVLLANAVGLVPYAGLVFLGIFTVGAATGQLALANGVGIATLWIWTWVFYGKTWALTYAIVVAVISIVRRALGSPDGKPWSFWDRLVFDRERPPALSDDGTEP